MKKVESTKQVNTEHETEVVLTDKNGVCEGRKQLFRCLARHERKEELRSKPRLE